MRQRVSRPAAMRVSVNASLVRATPPQRASAGAGHGGRVPGSGAREEGTAAWVTVLSAGFTRNPNARGTNAPAPAPAPHSTRLFTSTATIRSNLALPAW